MVKQIAAAVALLFFSAAAHAQTATPTSTPTSTATPLATAAPLGPDGRVVVLLDTTTVATGAPVDLSDAVAGTVQVTAIGTCSAYDLVVEMSLTNTDPVVWAPAIAFNGSVVANVDETAVAANASRIYTVPGGVLGWMRARTHTAVTSCRVRVVAAVK